MPYCTNDIATLPERPRDDYWFWHVRFPRLFRSSYPDDLGCWHLLLVRNLWPNSKDTPAQVWNFEFKNYITQVLSTQESWSVSSISVSMELGPSLNVNQIKNYLNWRMHRDLQARVMNHHCRIWWADTVVDAGGFRLGVLSSQSLQNVQWVEYIVRFLFYSIDHDTQSWYLLRLLLNVEYWI
jgi:hypothetical protein